MSKKIRGLIGIDLDGTVFNNEKKITPKVMEAITLAAKEGFVVVPITGRYLHGIPKELMAIEGINYAITSNGAAIYKVDDFANGVVHCLGKELLYDGKALMILEKLKKYDVIPDCFMSGAGHMRLTDREGIRELGVSKPIEEYLLNDREFVPSLEEYLIANPGNLEKITINFKLTEEGMKQKREASEELKEIFGISLVSGASHNLEVTSIFATKGLGLLKLANILDIDEYNTCAIGDDENDLDMIEKASFGIAMGNACEKVMKAASFVTKSNEEDGVVYAIEEFKNFLERGRVSDILNR